MGGGRHVGWEAGGRVEAAAVHAARWEGPTVEDEGRARAERTVNMSAMFVTLDVSKLSGWLNASAPCRVERERRGGRGGGTQGRGGGRAWGNGGGASSVQGGSQLRRGAGQRGGHTRSAHKTCSTWS